MSKARPDWHRFKPNLAKNNRRSGGWRAKKAGESAEELMMRVGTLYRAQGIAELRKRPEPYRRIGAAKSNGQFIAAPLSKSGPDFDVCLPDGRAGLIEVKSRKGKRVPLSAVGEIQSEALKRRIDWQGFGVIIIMLWEEGTSPRWWVVDAYRWDEARKRGLKSFSDKQLNEVATQCELLIGQGPHWLPALLRAHLEARQHVWPLHLLSEEEKRAITPDAVVQPDAVVEPDADP